MNHRKKMESARRSREIFAIAFGVIMVALFIWIACAVVSEIEDCGGVAKCLGSAMNDFDEARKGE